MSEFVPVPERSAVFATGGLLLGATALVGVLNPYEGGHYPTCPLLAITGLYCPFCGGLRAVHDLTRFDVAGALARNPLFVVLLPVIVYLGLRWALPAFTGRPARRLPLPRWWGGAAGALLLTYGVLRNLPGWTWLSPA